MAQRVFLEPDQLRGYMFKAVRLLAGAFAAVLSLALAPAASAQNLITNGGFEAGGLAPWISAGWGNSNQMRSGANAVITGCSGAPCLNPAVSSGMIHQDVVTTPGTSYTLTFWYRTTGGADTPVELQALVSNGVPTNGGAGTCTGSCVFGTQAATAVYAQVTRTFVATSASTRITILGRNDPGGMIIDDVSVVAAPAAVPTMSEWAMILLGLMLAGGAALYIQRRQALA